MALWRSVVGKLWMTIIALVAVVLIILGVFLLEYIDLHFSNSYDVKRLFVYIAILGFLLTTFFAFFLSSRITRPLVMMNRAAELMSKGDYSTRVPIVTGDEIGRLAYAMNLLAERLEQTISDLSLEKDRLANVLGSMTDAVIAFDATGKLSLANPQGDQLLEAWRSIRWEADETVPEDKVPEPIMSVYHAVLEKSEQVTTRLHVGEGVWSVVMAPLYTNGMVQGAVAVLREVTEEFRLEKQRRDFVANVSHELRTPLSMLQGYSEALLDGVAGTREQQQELTQVIYDESLRMGRLVQDLLDLSRMEAGRLELKRGRVEMGRLLVRVVRKYSGICKEQGIKIRHSQSEHAIALESGDADRIEQVLTNLIDNAMKHSGESPVIEVMLDKTEIAGKPAARLQVRDYGTGIHERDVPYLFDRFYKADKARTRGSSGGTGLGLAIAKNIVEAHRGTIEVQSAVGQGTCFTVVLPVQ